MQTERLSLEDFQLLQLSDNDELSQLLGGTAPLAGACHVTYPQGNQVPPNASTDCD